MKSSVRVLSILLVLLIATVSSVVAAPLLTYQVIKTYSHDPSAFTQGLVMDGKILYEGTGIHGASSLRRLDLASGRILAIRRLDSAYFGEGIAVAGNRIVQLTWQSGKGFVYDKETLRPITEFTYAGEGWGITFDGKAWIMSDGTPVLRFLDRKTFKVIRSIHVTVDGQPMGNLNELEHVEGVLYANIWGLDMIARISPQTGEVTGWIDLGELRKRLGKEGRAEVLNGIAWLAPRKSLLVTGKYWPKIFEIKLINP